MAVDAATLVKPRRPTQAASLPGLSVRHRGESLETVFSGLGEIRLLIAQQHMEVLEGRLAQGARLTLHPSVDHSGQSTEAYYLLEGSLRCDLPSASVTVGPGDWLITDQLEEPTIFSAQTDVRFFCLSSRAMFHEVSDTLSELKRLAVEVETKDGYTADHCERLQTLAYATGRELGLPHHRLYLLDYGAYLHDVGKVRVPVEILQKPAKLTPDEWRIINQHPTFGREMLEKTFMKSSGSIVEQHHERFDGSGYPFGLSRDDILIESYIVAVADTYDAMTTDRSYRRALPQAEACEEIRKYAGVHYPKDITRAFFSAIKKLER